MKNLHYMPILANYYGNDPNELHIIADAHRSLKAASCSNRRAGKVIFDIRQKTLINHEMPVQLEAKAPLHYNLHEISNHKIKLYTVDRRWRSP